MLRCYNTDSASPSYDSSWTRSVGLLNPGKDMNDDHFLTNPPVPLTLPRANVATVQRQLTSTMFQSRNFNHPQPEYIDQAHQLPTNEDFRYNIPLNDRFQSNKITNLQDL